MKQQTVDQKRRLLGHALWLEHGQRGGDHRQSADDLRRFDELYLGFYLSLEQYVPETFEGKKVLEVGLGFGTLGQLLASRGGEPTTAPTLRPGRSR